MLRATIVASSLCAVLMVAPHVRAAGDSEGGAAAAESLFQEARKLMDTKRYGEACPKFAASQRLAPAIGTLLNLADCYEKNNQLASAWARFHEAIALAQRLGRANREQTARERAEKLEPRLIKLSILSRSSSVEVKLDGNPIDPAALGTPIPVDPGKHTLEASAKGKKSFSTTFEVSEKSKTPSVEIPALEDEPKEKPVAGDDKRPDDKKTKAPPKEESGWSTQKTIGVIAMGAGAVGLGVGGYFGLKTSSTWKEAQTYCSGLECEQTGVDLASEAKSTGNIATIGVIAGGALLLGGAVLFFTAPSDGEKTGAAPRAVRVGVGPGSVVLGGSF
ncbi:MAG: hypothetical protein KF764_01180 [Labilithrix sp.]|nr:hypothetical protein [Labilithrix sp.]MBX3222079.1 hypothetical protein [Labilithrix sp.]